MGLNPAGGTISNAIMYKKLECCKYCSISFAELNSSERANHSRWCINNPKRPEYVTKNSGSQFQTPEVIAKRTIGIKKAHADGKYDHVIHTGNKGYRHTDATKQVLREKALASPHRRLRKKMIEYNGIWLDSTWELELAKRLDELKIKWIRPDPVKWTDDNNLIHNYFPDFYLPDYDLFLDPKNPQAYKVQEKKIKILLTQYKNLVIIKTLNECKDFKI